MFPVRAANRAILPVLWRDLLPASLAESVTADRLDTVLELRELVEQLQMAELPLGFGRD